MCTLIIIAPSASIKIFFRVRIRVALQQDNITLLWALVDADPVAANGRENHWLALFEVMIKLDSEKRLSVVFLDIAAVFIHRLIRRNFCF